MKSYLYHLQINIDFQNVSFYRELLAFMGWSVIVDNMRNVNEVKDYLEKNKVTMLFDTPRHRPEFTSKDDETYYQIMFESPDKILFEVVFIGPKKNSLCN